MKSIHTLSNPVIAEKSNGFGIPETAGVASLLCPEGNPAPAEVVAPAASDFSSSKRKKEKSEVANKNQFITTAKYISIFQISATTNYCGKISSPCLETTGVLVGCQKPKTLVKERENS